MTEHACVKREVKEVAREEKERLADFLNFLTKLIAYDCLLYFGSDAAHEFLDKAGSLKDELQCAGFQIDYLLSRLRTVSHLSQTGFYANVQEVISAFRQAHEIFALSEEQIAELKAGN